jgi:hypothetical protein
MVTSVKLLLVLSFLIPMHVQATHQYSYKNIPLSFNPGGGEANTTNFSSADVLICIPDQFPKASTQRDAELEFSGQIINLLEAFGFSEDVDFLQNASIPNSNRNHSLSHDTDVLFVNCYSNAVYSNLFEFQQMESPVSPVPELPGAVLLISGLGFMAFVYRCKH